MRPVLTRASIETDGLGHSLRIPDMQSMSRTAGGYLADFVERLGLQLTSDTIWLQVAAVAVSVLLGFLTARLLKAAAGSYFGDIADGFRGGKYDDALRSIVVPALISTFLWTFTAGLANGGAPVDYMRIVGAILVAIVLARFFALPRSDPFVRYGLLSLIWFSTSLVILRLFAKLIGFIDSIILPFGESLSILDIIKALAIAIALVWTAAFVSRLVEVRLRSTVHLASSVRGLLSQLVRIVMIGAAIVLALNTIGIDLTALAVFTGALGVGIGFGLQSIFSNFVAGIIIILEKTLKVGDFIDLEGGITGEVQDINVRSTLIRTNDNIDMLIPNSEFISKRVINWTLDDAKRRIHVPVGVAYGSDKALVKTALLEAADNVEFTLKGSAARSPDVWLVNFGDSSLDFELVVWLTDGATKRPGRVHAAYCWEIETQLAKHGITIPFPQRDLHFIKSENQS